MTDEESRAELIRVNTALNNWMNRTFFGSSPARKPRKKRVKPCPGCGAEIGVTKPMCYKCFTALLDDSRPDSILCENRD